MQELITLADFPISEEIYTSLKYKIFISFAQLPSLDFKFQFVFFCFSCELGWYSICALPKSLCTKNVNDLAIIMFYIFAETPGTNSTHNFTPLNNHWPVIVGVIIGQWKPDL